MEKKSTKESKGTALASAGGLCTTLSLTIIENPTAKIIAAATGLVLAFWGLMILLKAKKDSKTE